MGFLNFKLKVLCNYRNFDFVFFKPFDTSNTASVARLALGPCLQRPTLLYCSVFQPAAVITEQAWPHSPQEAQLTWLAKGVPSTWCVCVRSVMCVECWGRITPHMEV